MSIPSDNIGSAADASKMTMLRSDSTFPSRDDDSSSRAGDRQPEMYDVDFLQSSPGSKKKPSGHNGNDRELSEASMVESVASEKIPASAPAPPPPPPPPPQVEVRPLTLREKFNALNDAFAIAGNPKTQAAIWALVRQWVDVRKNVDENKKNDDGKSSTKEAAKAKEKKKTERMTSFMAQSQTLINEVAGDLIRKNEKMLRESRGRDANAAVQYSSVSWAKDADGEDNGGD